MENCVFCDILHNKTYAFENDLAVAFADIMPASPGHHLIIPKRHCRIYFDLTPEEIEAMFELSKVVKEYIDKKHHPDGYNVGFNVEEAGGQSVFHAHLHVIPRYHGDVEHPRGGIRKVSRLKNM